VSLTEVYYFCIGQSSSFFEYTLYRLAITANVLQLGEVADLEALTFDLVLMFI
jgi:hypothetical protein